MANPTSTLSASDTVSKLQEALGMASMVSLRQDLSVTLGDWWAFNWETNEIHLPMDELARCPNERISWIILHEAAHAALTRLHDILAKDFRREEIHLLLNVIEDVRIERWLINRFPGSASWRKVAHRYDQENRPQSLGYNPADHPVRSFLKGIFHLAEEGRIPDGMNPVAATALLECANPLSEAFSCVPPTSDANESTATALYQAHPVSQSYAEIDECGEPSPFEKWVRIMQAAMWEHVANGVLPVYLKLVKQFGAISFPFGTKVRTVYSRSGRKSLSATRLTDEMRRKLENAGNGPYLSAIEKHSGTIQKTNQTLLEMLPNHRSLQHVRKRRTGDRLDLRIACQFEADRRLHEQLWMQRRRRSLPDPAFVITVDRSHSMKEDQKCTAAFESLVILREACTRSGIPLAIVAFNNSATVLSDWHSLSLGDSHAEAVLSAILKVDGGTCIESGIETSVSLLKKRPERDRFLFLLTDGMCDPLEERILRNKLAQLERDSIRIIAIGIGRDTQGLHRICPSADFIETANELQNAVSASLIRCLGSELDAHNPAKRGT